MTQAESKWLDLYDGTNWEIATFVFGINHGCIIDSDTLPPPDQNEPSYVTHWRELENLEGYAELKAMARRGELKDFHL